MHATKSETKFATLLFTDRQGVEMPDVVCFSSDVPAFERDLASLRLVFATNGCATHIAEVDDWWLTMELQKLGWYVIAHEHYRARMVTDEARLTARLASELVETVH